MGGQSLLLDSGYLVKFYIYFADFMHILIKLCYLSSFASLDEFVTHGLLWRDAISCSDLSSSFCKYWGVIIFHWLTNNTVFDAE